MKYDFQSFLGGALCLWFFIQTMAILLGEIKLFNRELGINTVGFNWFNTTYLILCVLVCAAQLFRLFR